MTSLHGRLKICIESAKGLMDCDSWGGISDPYCILKLDDEEMGRTCVIKDESSPEWNEEFHFNAKGDAEELKIEVWDEDSMRRDDLLGFITIPVSGILSCDKDTPFIADLMLDDDTLAGSIKYSIRYRPFGTSLFHEGSGNKKALQIGINYVDLPEDKGRLNGCHNDVQTLHDLITDNYGFASENCRILTDEKGSDMLPTKKNIEESIAWLIEDAKAGDTLIFQFSGHGSQVPDEDGDEEDAQDETIIPCDYKKNGQISDDELFKMLVAPLPKGVLLTVIMDCCHSGTGMDLAFIHKVKQGEDSDSIDFNGFSEKNKKSINDEKQNTCSKTSLSSMNYDNTSDATVLMLSGCMDDQTSADATIGGKASGAMTFAFSEALKQKDGKCSYKELVSSMYELLEENGYSQIPQLSTACPFDLESPFTL